MGAAGATFSCCDVAGSAAGTGAVAEGAAGAVAAAVAGASAGGVGTATAAGHWSDNSGRTELTAATPVVIELRLSRDGAWQATLRLLTDGRLHVEAAGAAPLSAQLPPDGATALQRGPDGDAAAGPR
ncbi:MAG TPA: hypothetical protein VIP05_14460 [Burkholderiaceae bacterium]